METKGGEHDVGSGKTRRGAQPTGWRTGAPTACEPRCPSLFDVASLESGGLTAHRRAAVLAHSRRCPRCGLSLAELTQARGEILGATPAARAAQAQRAAQLIADALRLRLH